MAAEQLVCLHDRAVVEQFFRSHNVALHLYELGDLDPFFWDFTTWYALRSRQNQSILAIALLYTATDLPVLLALCDPSESVPYIDLVRRLRNVLPQKFYCHITLCLVDTLKSYCCRMESHGTYDKFLLPANVEIPAAPAAPAVEPLSSADLLAAEKLYAAAYAGNWFDSRMLETGLYVGVRSGDPKELVAVGGVHVFSAPYRTGVLGNVTTHPLHRNRGLGNAVTAAVCRALRSRGAELIGLNVRADNAQAIACYRRVGFQRVGSCEEFMCWLQPQ